MSVRVGPFQLLKCIGVGGMAEVWSAVHASTNTLIAVKVLKDEAADPKLRAAFRREVRTAAALDHPHIAQILDHGVLDADSEFKPGSPWFAMELARHGTLRDRRGTLPWPELLQVLTQTLQALSHAHARGVIHRDIKPDNVLMGTHGVLLADFGLAHRLVHELSRGDPAGGSPAYMAPEQFRRREAEMGPWTDLYGVGCLGWALATGKPPFWGLATVDAFRNAHVYQEPGEFVPTTAVPLELEGWLRALLRKSPPARPAFAADAAFALAQMGEPIAADSGPIPEAEGLGSETWHDLDLAELPAPNLPAVHRADQVDGAILPAPFPPDWRRSDPPQRQAIPGLGLTLIGTRDGSLVGRHAERDAAWTELGRVHARGRPRALLLTGPAGIGTHRLAEWMVRRSVSTGAARAIATSHSPVAPPASGLAWAVANLLRAGPLPFEAALDRLQRAPQLAHLIDPVDRASLAALLDRLATGRPSTPAEVDAAMVPLLRALTVDRPAIFWLASAEHSASSLAFVERLLDRGDVPVLLLLSTREDTLAQRPTETAIVERLTARDDVFRLDLGPLPPIDRPALVRSILPLAPDLAARIEARTAGHPGFTSELIRDLAARDLLIPTERGYAARPGLELPADLGETWQRRLDRAIEALTPEQIRALHVASMLWTDLIDLSWQVICRHCGVDTPDVVVEGLIVQGLARRMPDDRGWSFALGLRDALIATDLPDRPELHQICALVVHERDGGAESEAHHWLAAGELDRAVAPLKEAIRERLTLGHYAEAEGLLDRRAALLSPEDPRHGAGEVLRSAMHRFLGEVEAGEAVLAALDERSELPGWEELAGDIAMARGALAYQRGLPWEAVEQLHEAEAKYLALPDPPQGLPGCRVHLADCLMRLGRLEEARDALEQALEGFRAQDHPAGAANAMLALGGLALRTGEEGEAQTWLERAANSYAELGVRYGLAETNNRMGELARMRGDLDEAEALYRKSATDFDALGSVDGLIPRLNLGLVQVQRERWEEAVEVLEQTSAIAVAQRRDLGDVSRALLLPCYAALARWTEFDQGLAQTRKVLADTGLVHPDLAEQAENSARICAREGQPQRARKAAKLAIDQWRRLNRMDEVHALEGFVSALDL